MDAASFLLTIFVFSWLLASVSDNVFSPPPLTLEPERFSSLGRPQWDDLKVGICLSGGGYRAALLHAGVLQCLEEQGVKVTTLSTVSGGSIIGSFYVLGGRPRDFLQAVRNGRFNLKRELMHAQNAVRLPFPAELPVAEVRLLPFFEFSRNDVQRQLLDKTLLNGSEWNDIPTDDGPDLLVCATDLRNGLLLGFTSGGTLFRGPKEARFSPRTRLFTNISDTVAVSGAFPGAFAAKHATLTNEHSWFDRFIMFDRGDTNALKVDVTLVDGGAIDNLGLELLLTAHQQASHDRMHERWEQDVILVSNGGMLIQSAEDVNGLDVVLRAIEVGTTFPSVMREQNSSHWFSQNDPGAPPVHWLSPWLLKKPADAVLHGEPANISDPTIIEAMGRSGLTHEILSKLVALHPDADRMANTLRELRTVAPTPENSSLSEKLTAFTAYIGLRKALYEGIESDIEHCIDIFTRTPTLVDHPPRTDADAIFRLGQYLVLLRWNAIQKTLDEKAQQDLPHD